MTTDIATEQEADKACQELRVLIEGAENANQAAEDAVVQAADSARLVQAVLAYADAQTTATRDAIYDIVGTRHYHVGPGDQCRLCLRDYRHIVHLRVGEAR